MLVLGERERDFAVCMHVLLCFFAHVYSMNVCMYECIYACTF